MPLITTPSQLAAGELLDATHSLGGYLSVCAAKANAMVRTLLALSDADLAAFCNALGPQELNSVLTRHAETGAAINLALSQVNATLAESGRGTIAGGVDVRPFSDKLDAQWRKLEMDGNGVFSVAAIPQPEAPPEPQMGGEPEPEPQQPNE